MEQGRKSLGFLKSLGSHVPGKLKKVYNNPINPNENENKVTDQGKTVPDERPSEAKLTY